MNKFGQSDLPFDFSLQVTDIFLTHERVSSLQKVITTKTTNVRSCFLLYQLASYTDRRVITNSIFDNTNEPKPFACSFCIGIVSSIVQKLVKPPCHFRTVFSTSNTLQYIKYVSKVTDTR